MSIVRYEGSCQRSDEVVLGEIIVLIEGFSRIALVWWGLILVGSAFLSSRLCKAEAHSQNWHSGRVER